MPEEKYLLSLERYLYRKMAWLRKCAEGVVLIVVGVVVGLSIGERGLAGSTLSAGAFPDDIVAYNEMIRGAAMVGDYDLAERLYQESEVLGIRSYDVDHEGLEYIVYPERIIQKEAKMIDEFLANNSASREILELAADLHVKMGNEAISNNYLLEAEYLDSGIGE